MVVDASRVALVLVGLADEWFWRMSGKTRYHLSTVFTAQAAS
jgi:hypothetical protein